MIPETSRKIYGNYKVFSPDDILMFRCDEKKANWYLKRDIASIVKPNTIKLKFTPRGLGNHNKPFGLDEMRNVCVNCGETEMLTRHHIVPICYRKFFPLDLKSHNFHDVLALCTNCHEDYERKADDLKKYLSEKYNSPINGDIEYNRDIAKFTKIASIILNSEIKIPHKRLLKIREELKVFLGVKKLTKKRLTTVSETKYIIVRKTHGEIVMSQVEDLQSFIEMWRTHFIENNKCEFLPKSWNVKT